MTDIHSAPSWAPGFVHLTGGEDPIPFGFREELEDFVAYFLRTHAPSEWAGRLDRLLASTMHRVAAGKALQASFRSRTTSWSDQSCRGA